MSNQQNLVGTKIKKLREEFGLTQEDLAKRLNIPRPSVSQIELGKRDLTTSELTKLSKIFEISIDEFTTVQ